MSSAFKITPRDSELKNSSTFVHQNTALMAKNLVIVESPAKAKTIEKFLGKDFKVALVLSHLVDVKH